MYMKLETKILASMKLLFLLISLMLSIPFATHSQTVWSFELHGGNVYNVPMPLIISQQDQPDIRITARYDSESLILPVYWDMRLSRWTGTKSL